MSQQSKLQHFLQSASSSTASHAISSSDSDEGVPSEKKKKVELSVRNGLKTVLGYSIMMVKCFVIPVCKRRNRTPLLVVVQIFVCQL